MTYLGEKEGACCANCFSFQYSKEDDSYKCTITGNYNSLTKCLGSWTPDYISNKDIERIAQIYEGKYIVTQDIGTCIICKQGTSSGMINLCPSCLQEIKQIRNIK